MCEQKGGCIIKFRNLNIIFLQFRFAMGGGHATFNRIIFGAIITNADIHT